MSPFALGLKGMKLSGAEMESAAGGKEKLRRGSFLL